MRKYIYYLVLFPMIVFANSNRVVSTIDKSHNLGMLVNYPDTSINLSLSDFLTQPSGGGGGTLSIKSNVLSLSIGGSWTATQFKVGIIKNLNISPALPNMELGQIMANSDKSPSGVFAKIENNNLVFYSPFYLTAVNTSLSAPVTGGVSGYTVSLPNPFVCNPSGGGGAGGSISITNGLATLNISGSWSNTCNLKTGQIVYLATTPISNVELGIIKDGTRETNFRAKIEGNWLVFYNAVTPPALVSLCDFRSIKDLDGGSNSYSLDAVGNYPNYNQSLSTSDFILGGAGGGSGSISIANNVLSVSFGGSCSPQVMKTGVIKTLTVSPALPNMELGPILTSSTGVNNGYFAKIENNSLIFYSPLFLTGIGTTVSTAIVGGAPGVNSSFTLPSLYACTASGGGSSGNLSIANGIATLYISGGWANTCNLKLGQIVQLTGVSIPDTELGILYHGTVATAYRAKIQSNWLVFYTTETVPALPSGFSLNFSKIFGNSVVKNDNFLHWTHTISYDVKGNPIGSSRTYFDDLGKSNVSLSMDFVSNKIWGTETTFDNFGRADKTSFVAPSSLTSFKKVGFLTIGTNYHTANYNLTNYYSDSNSNELYQATATQPYSQNNYDTLNPGNIINVVGGNKINGVWKTGYSYTVPAAQEMYYVYGLDYYGGTVTAGKEEVITKFYKTVNVDANGVENVVFTDGEGKVLTTARSGGATTYPVVSLIGTQGFVDVHIPNGIMAAQITLLGAATLYKAFDLKTGLEITPITTSSFVGGNAYRIVAITPPLTDPKTYVTVATGALSNDSGALGISYRVNYYDYAVNIYNKTGQLIKAIQPNGYVANSTIVPVPAHMASNNFATTYKYNTLGQLLETTSPDEGTSRFAYRKDGQIRYSQSALQNDTKVSYTDYDSLGRPKESGVITGTVGIWALAIANPDAALISGTRSEQTFTVYDFPENNLTSVALPTTPLNLTLTGVLTTAGIPSANYSQNNLSGNVAITYTKPGASITAITWYSYDIYGRTEWMVQYNEGIGAKTIHYYYDYKGNVKRVIYQKDKTVELFAHQYTYDANDVLKKVETSTNLTNIGTPNEAGTFITHADYTYYQTGELKRVNIAQGLQGLDYVYTLGGQLKSINHPSLEAAKDPGGDANDVFGITLDYYVGDYLRTGRNITSSPSVGADYNGNIKAARWANKGVAGDYSGSIANQKGYLYNYDRNNWLTGATFGNTNSTTAVISPTAAFSEGSLSYDANGNIKTLQRTNDASVAIDNLTYNYTGKNQLSSVTDVVASTTATTDIDTQAAGNYTYNVIGQMMRNNQEDINYDYNTQGLVKQVSKGGNPVVRFFYNERGQRIKKESYNTASPYGLTSTDYYIVDPSGNVMSIYNQPSGGAIVQKDLPIFGLSRLGVYNRASALSSYEITDHLGNVRAVVQKVSGSPVIKSFADYYPFGEQLPGRNSLNYRYAFQGQELDTETNMEAFQLRLWDGRIGRWLSPDPYGEFASPYLGMGNNPVSTIDPDGGCTKCPKGAASGATYEHDVFGTLTSDGNGNWSNAQYGTVMDDASISRGGSMAYNVGRTALDFVPIAGSSMDIYEGFRDGNGWQVAMGATFLVVDVATLGSGSLLKGGIKTLGKEVAEEAVEQVAKKGFKSFSSFKRAYGTAGKGNAWHHIVEQNKSNISKFGAETIHNIENLKILPHGKGSVHAKISGYYSSLMPGTNMRVRDYVNTLSYDEQYKFGIDVLNRFSGTP